MRVLKALQPKADSHDVVFRRDRGNQPRTLKTKRRVGNDVWTIHVLTNIYRGRSGRQRLTRTTLVRHTLETNAGAFYHVRVPGYPYRVFKIPSRHLLDAFFGGRAREACTLYLPLTGRGGITFPFWRYEVRGQPASRRPRRSRPSSKK